MVLALLWILFALGPAHPRVAREDPAAVAPVQVSVDVAPSLERARALAAAAREARSAKDSRAARARVTEAVDLVVALPESAGGADCEAALSELGTLAAEVGDIQAARSARERLVARLEKNRSPEDPDLLQSLAELAATIARQGDPRRAKVLQERVLAGRRSTLSEDDPLVLRAKIGLAETTRTLGDPAGARALQEEVVAVLERTPPADLHDLARARMGLANTLYQQNDYTGARALQERVVGDCAAAFGEDDAMLRGARGNLAITLFDLGELDAARSLQEAVLAACERELPDDHPELAHARRGLANTVATQGDLKRARELEEAVLATFEQSLPDDHDDVLRARGNLAVTLTQMGEYAPARILQERVLEVRERKLPGNHPDLARTRMNLASVLVSQGDLPEALSLQERVVEVFDRALPADHPTRIGARANLARTLYLMHQDQRAVEIQGEVLQAWERTRPAGHPDIDAARANLANTLFRLGEAARARELRIQVLESAASSLPEAHPLRLEAESNLARSLLLEGDLDAASEHLGRVLRLGVQSLPPFSPQISKAREITLWLLAARLRTASDPAPEAERQQWRELFREQARLFGEEARRRVVLALLESSPREAEERVASRREDVALALSFAAGLGTFPADAALNRDAFLLVEQSRSTALASARIGVGAVSDPAFEGLRRRVRAASAELTRRAQSGGRAEDLDAARAELDGAQRDLVLRGAAHAGGSKTLDPDLDALAAVLGPRDALVSWLRYESQTLVSARPVAAAGVNSLCAFVLRKGNGGGAPVLTRHELGRIDRIASAVEDWRRSAQVSAERGLAGGADPRTELTRRGAELRELVLDPLRSALLGADRAIVALDDVLHTVPLDALPAGEAWGGASGSEALLGDVLRVEVRASLLELLAPRAAAPRPDALLALGHPAFDSEPEDVEDAALTGGPVLASAARAGSAAGVLRGGAWERGFATLPATRDEVRAIGQYFEDAFGAEAPARVLTRRAASRESLVELAPNARWLHVATHGWFAPESVRSSEDRADAASGLAAGGLGDDVRARGSSPLLLSGLALAGANLPADGLGRIPGLVTAQEIAALDLSGCELAVLSACDTNVGVRRAGQGVASLQRALHMAGARSVITSLWKVPDEATRELMTDFYRRLWIQKKPKHQALWEAKRMLRESRDENGSPRYSPRDWAAWVLTGEPD
ncbi:MAG: CHAT domain-containing protein [Planctomycetota bacterium]|nr:CHAT domain-containing protein [Planctomycetota bacterium]